MAGFLNHERDLADRMEDGFDQGTHMSLDRHRQGLNAG